MENYYERRTKSANSSHLQKPWLQHKNSAPNRLRPLHTREACNWKLLTYLSDSICYDVYMLRRTPATMVRSFGLLLILLVTSSLSQAVSASGLMSHMTMKHTTTTSQCQSMCGSQAPVAATIVKHREQDKEPNPLPVAPQSLIIPSLWLLVSALVALVLRRYLQWRPPDLNVLQCCYRF